MNLRHCALSSLAAAAAIALPLEGGLASTCKDALDRFENRLYESSIPSTDPQLFQELVRAAERAAELRDEQQCLQRVAELDEALAERAPRTSGSRAAAAEDKADEPARPKAPILLVTGDGDETQPAADDEDDDTD